MNTPYIGFGNETLWKLPKVSDGQEVKCNRCNGYHLLEAGKNEKGEKTEQVMFIRCGETLYLGAVAGRLVINTKADVSGHI